MKTFAYVDESGEQFEGQATDLRALTQVHFMTHGRDIVKAEVVDQT